MKNQERSEKIFPQKSKILKQRNIAKKDHSCLYNKLQSNSKIDTNISNVERNVDAQLTKTWCHNLKVT